MPVKVSVWQGSSGQIVEGSVSPPWSGRCGGDSCRSSAVWFKQFNSSQLSLFLERKLVSKMFVKLWLHKMSGKRLASGTLTETWFLDCFLEHLLTNWMALLDCHCALICASFLGLLINWTLPGADGGSWQQNRLMDPWTCQVPQDLPVFHICPLCLSKAHFSGGPPARLELQTFVLSYVLSLYCPSKPCIFNSYWTKSEYLNIFISNLCVITQTAILPLL